MELGKKELTLRKIPAIIAAMPPDRIRFALDIYFSTLSSYSFHITLQQEKSKRIVVWVTVDS
jgi:hypothetical protein